MKENIHVPGHEQILIKDNIVIASLIFVEHDYELMQKTFQKYDYDEVVDSCLKHQLSGIGDIWNGKKFVAKPFPSWVKGDDLKWHPPKQKPEGDYKWVEETQSWILVPKATKAGNCGEENEENIIGNLYEELRG